MDLDLNSLAGTLTYGIGFLIGIPVCTMIVEKLLGKEKGTSLEEIRLEIQKNNCKSEDLEKLVDRLADVQDKLAINQQEIVVTQKLILQYLDILSRHKI